MPEPRIKFSEVSERVEVRAFYAYVNGTYVGVCRSHMHYEWECSDPGWGMWSWVAHWELPLELLWVGLMRRSHFKRTRDTATMQKQLRDSMQSAYRTWGTKCEEAAKAKAKLATSGSGEGI